MATKGDERYFYYDCVYKTPGHLPGHFENLYLNHSKVSIGYKEDENAKPDDMLVYYSMEEIKNYGVLGIEIKVL